MTTERAKRKLVAILSADVKGYSRLMGEDEEATVRTLTAYREIMSNLIEQFGGRVVDSPGDNLLAEFGSVVDAVECSVEIQKQIKIRNAEVPGDRKMQFRIGVNLGDVIEQRERIYGDGVNITARIEGLAEGGGICISGIAYDSVKNKLDLDYEYLGEQKVKNVAEPVRVYRVVHEAVTAIHGKREMSLPDKPSLAVLPFDNMSGDPEQEYFSDGITEDLITDLSKISGLFVIARNSVFTYKGKAVKIAEVGRELGVRYILEGSVRKAGQKVRITAQLVDTVTEGHRWAERYDRDLENIFALQDEVTQKIVAALAVNLTEDEQERLERKYTDNLDAYDHNLRGMECFSRATKESNAQARELFEKAIELDAQYASAYSRLGRTYMMEWNFGWTEDPQSLDRALELAQKAIALDDALAEAHSLLGEVYLWKKQHDKAIDELEKAIVIDPNNADCMADFAYILTWAGGPEQAIDLVRKAMRLNPLYPTYYLFQLGHAYFLMGDNEEAIEALKRVRNRNPNFTPAYAYLAASYVELGLKEKAQSEAAQIGDTSSLSLAAWRQRLPYKDEADVERLFQALRKAGLK